MQQPLFDAGYPDYTHLYHKLGINPSEYKHPTDIKHGLPGQSENTTVGFFPKLGVGLVLPNGNTLKFERRNAINKFDIDFQITRSGEPIAFIDNEQRINDFPFLHPDAPLNVPIHSFNSNTQQWQDRPLSNKSEYYLSLPKRCFHLARQSNMNAALCCHAKDFVHLKPETNHTFFGGMLVWRVPRSKTCFGKIHEHTIEDWILLKLDQEGLL